MIKPWMGHPSSFHQEPQPSGQRARGGGDVSGWLGIQEPAVIAEKRARWALGLPRHVRLPPGHTPHIIAIGGGKGGVGKSLLSANLAAKLAESGARVLLVDLD